MPRRFTVGLISDTHGLLRPEALAALSGCGHILHAGDIGDPAILESLGAIAPVTAVRGNNDRGPWAEGIPEREMLELAGTWFYLLHDLAELDIDPVAAGVRVVVAGHSHKPACEERDGVWYVNPGSAGPRRFTLPIAVARLEIDDGEIDVRHTELAVSR
jgi:putative phosphoesterase